ncbi:hypothetical protein B296_00036155 [Ensete ventricosum]|uniref:Uncharacterized protein n=1 Tax=Ensete ventricosum TaxID=4639 RepID=A0A427A3Q1_ENSVE|nr:hypothetical protein B296_00036155 [Ensete ventricosum]
MQTFNSAPKSKRERTPTMERSTLHSRKKHPCEMIASATCAYELCFSPRCPKNSITVTPKWVGVHDGIPCTFRSLSEISIKLRKNTNNFEKIYSPLHPILHHLVSQKIEKCGPSCRSSLVHSRMLGFSTTKQ